MTGQVSLQFAIYDAETGGTIVWESSEKRLDLGSSGFYSVTLGGSDNPIESENLKGGPLWIGLTVDGGEELTPRLPLESVPYAVRAGRAESVEEGAVGSDALAEGAVGNDAVSSLEWSKVQGKPQTVGELSCSMNQFAEFDGVEWSCGTPSSPLNGQSCGMGQVAAGIDSSGNLQCTTDQDTVFSAGAGLSQSGTTFNLQDQSCSSGQFVDGIQNGSLQCSGTGAITGVTTGSGLSGGGNSGSVNISLADQSCSSGEAVEGISSGSVQCRSVGDISAVSAGQGLSGGGSSGSVTVDADFSSVQQRVSGNCSNGDAMTDVNQDGTVDCEQPGEGGSPTSSSTTCGTFVPLQTCPIGSAGIQPGCEEAAVGAMCEYDSINGSNDCNLNSTLDNCGAFDWYMKTSN